MNVTSLTSVASEDAESVARTRVEDLSDICGEELLSFEKENSSDFEKQSASGKTLNTAQAVDENDLRHAKMMEIEPLLEASVERNLRSINLTHGDYPCHCLAQMVWYPEKSNLCLIWVIGEIRSRGLSDYQKNASLFVVSSMLALR